MSLVQDFARDLQYGARMWRKAPLVFTAVAITLAIGIGLDTGAFTVINGLLLRPRTDYDAPSFARLYAEYTQGKRPTSYGGQFSVSGYRTLERESRVLSQLAAWRTEGVLIEDDAVRTLDMEVSCNFFAVYGLQAAKLGRLFRTEECAEGAAADVAILSEEMWRRRFAGDPQIVGHTILLNRVPFTVVGITPMDFAGRLRGPGVWVPLSAQSRLTTAGDIFRNNLHPSLWLEGRLRPHMTRAALSSEMSVIAPRVELPSRDLNLHILVTSGAMIEDPNIRSGALWIMLVVIAGLTLLLLVSCANVAVLLLSRAPVRRREIAVRLSLGASRRRVVSQLIAENLVLAVGAAGIGIWLAVRVPMIFQTMIPFMPHYPFGLDWHITAYLVGITFFASFLAGLAPAAECLRQNVWHTLKAGASRSSSGPRGWSIRDLLVITQVFCSIVLMSVSAMYIRAEFAILNADPGFETRQVLQVPVQLSTERFNPADSSRYYGDLQRRLLALPAVETVAYGSASPLGGDPEEPGQRMEFRLPTQSQAEARATNLRTVSANYFSALGIPIVLGHAFAAAPIDPTSVVVSRSFASAFWPNQDPIEKTVIASDGQQLRIIGVARDTRVERFSEPDSPVLYRVRAGPAPGDIFLLRFRGDSQPLQRSVQAAVRELDPQVFVLQTTLRAALDDMADRMWILGKMLLTVALVAGGLALLGIYGVVGYSVATRTREFGIRAALGADRGSLMRLVFSSGLRPVVAGTLMGLTAAIVFAFVVSGALRNAPVQVVSSDPVAYAAVCILLLSCSIAAMLGHARRAASTEPLVALRDE